MKGKSQSWSENSENLDPKEMMSCVSRVRVILEMTGPEWNRIFTRKDNPRPNL